MALTLDQKIKKAKSKRSQAIMSKINILWSRDGHVSPDIEAQSDIDLFNLQQLFCVNGNAIINYDNLGVDGLIRLYYHISYLLKGTKRNNIIYNANESIPAYCAKGRAGLTQTAEWILSGTPHYSGFFPGWQPGEQDNAPDYRGTPSDDLINEARKGTFNFSDSSFQCNRDLIEVETDVWGYPPDEETGHLSAAIQSVIDLIGSNSSLGVKSFIAPPALNEIMNVGEILGERNTDVYPYNYISGGGGVPDTYNYGNSAYDTDGQTITNPVFVAHPDYWQQAWNTSINSISTQIDAVIAYIEQTKIDDVEPAYFVNTSVIPGRENDWTLQNGWISNLNDIKTAINDFYDVLNLYYPYGGDYSKTNPTGKTAIENALVLLKSDLTDGLDVVDTIYNTINAGSDADSPDFGKDFFGDPSDGGLSLWGLRAQWIKSIIDAQDGSKVILESLGSIIETMSSNITKAEEQFALFGISKETVDWSTVQAWSGGLVTPEINGISEHKIVDIDIESDTFGELIPDGYIISWESTAHAVGYNVWRSMDWNGTDGTWTKLMPSEHSFTVEDISTANGQVYNYYIDLIDTTGEITPYYKIKAYDDGGGGDYIRIPADSEISNPKTITDFASTGTTSTPSIPTSDEAGDGGDTTPASSWKNPVLNYSGLPTSDNNDGDVRLVINEGVLYFWDADYLQWKSLGGTGGSENTWKEPVETTAFLPTSGNNDGDTRLVYNENMLYRWNADKLQWEIVGGSSGDPILFAHNQLTDMPSDTNSDHDGRYYTETELNSGILDSRYYTRTELVEGGLDGRYYTEDELTGGILDSRYYTESEINGGILNDIYYIKSDLDGGILDSRYYTETEIDSGILDSRYYTETELNSGVLDFRYYTETEFTGGILDSRYFTETELTSGTLDSRYFTETEINSINTGSSGALLVGVSSIANLSAINVQNGLAELQGEIDDILDHTSTLPTTMNDVYENGSIVSVDDTNIVFTLAATKYFSINDVSDSSKFTITAGSSAESIKIDTSGGVSINVDAGISINENSGATFSINTSGVIAIDSADTQNLTLTAATTGTATLQSASGSVIIAATASTNTAAISLTASAGGIAFTSAVDKDIAINAGGTINFDDKFLSTAVPLSQSGVTGLSSNLTTATSIIGAINENTDDLYVLINTTLPAQTDGSAGSDLIGATGISGIIPTGGSIGGNGTVQSMMEGIALSAGSGKTFSNISAFTTDKGSGSYFKINEIIFILDSNRWVIVLTQNTNIIEGTDWDYIADTNRIIGGGSYQFNLTDSASDSFKITSVGGIDINVSTISLNGTGNSNISITGANLTLSTITSGNVILTSAAEIQFTDSRVSEIELSDVSNTTLPGSTTSIIGAINAAYTEATNNTLDSIYNNGTGTRIITLDDGSIRLDVTDTYSFIIADSSGTTLVAINALVAGDVLDINTSIDMDGLNANFTLTGTSADSFKINTAGGIDIDSQVGISLVDDSGASVVISSSGAININGATDQNIAIDTTGTGKIDINSSNAFELDSAANSYIKITGGDFTIQTVTSGEIYFDDARTGAIPFSDSSNTVLPGASTSIIGAIRIAYENKSNEPTKGYEEKIANGTDVSNDYIITTLAQMPTTGTFPMSPGDLRALTNPIYLAIYLNGLRLADSEWNYNYTSSEKRITFDGTDDITLVSGDKIIMDVIKITTA